MNMTLKPIWTPLTRGLNSGLLLLLLVAAPLLDVSFAKAAQPQQKSLPPASTAARHRTRLILKDGSYQVIMSYRVAGNIVFYISAERGGAEEEIPSNLVDFEATKRWDQQHSAPSEGDVTTPTGIDPELLKEEAERASFTPLVAPDLHLPEEYSVLALDTFHSTPELVPLAQTAGDLNRDTGHSVVKGIINPQSSPHKIAELKRETSLLQLHIADPVIYMRIGNQVAPPSSSTPITVDTHGATGNAAETSVGGSPDSRYVIVRTDIRTDSRLIASFRLDALGTGRHQEGITETTTELLSGGHWMKITPAQPLTFGEYVLLEVLSDRDVNLAVWDFGIHPVAPENRDALKPETNRRQTLERHRPE
jgi:hypothetical protein